MMPVMRQRSWLAAACLLILAAAGTIPQAPSVAVAAPTRDAEQGGKLERSEKMLQQLERNKDRYERIASRMSLLEAIQTGLRRNPVLAKGYALIQEGQWQAIAIQREWVPTLAANSGSPGLVGYSLERYQSNSNDYPSDNLVYQGVFTVPKVQLQWTFFDPTRAPRERANLASVKADTLLFDVSARELVLEIQQDYYQLQNYTELERYYTELFAITKNIVKIARHRAKTLESNQGQIAQLKSLEFSLLTRRINMHEEVLKAAAQLARNLSLTPGQLAIPSEPLHPDGSWDMALQATIDQALALREEIQQSLTTADHFSWNAVAATNSTLPTLYLMGEGELIQNRYQQRDLSRTPSTLTLAEENSLTANAGLFFNWPIFDGGINMAEAKALRKQSDQAKQQAELDRLTATSQVQSSHASYISSLNVMDSASDELKAARLAAETARDDFAKGRTNATTAVQTLEGLRRAAENYYNSVAKHNTAVAELYRYSASWPQAALPLLKQRVDQLRRQ